MLERAPQVEQVPHRRALRWAFGLLAFLYGTAVFAPLLASDLPLMMVAANERAFSRALRTLPFVVDEYVDGRAQDAASEETLEPIRFRLRELERGLPSVQADALAEFKAQFDASLSSREELAQLSSSARELVSELSLASQAEAGTALRATRSFPAFAALSPLDGFSIGAWFALVLAPFFSRRRRAKWLFLSLGAAGLFAVAIGLSGESERASGLKAEMTAGGVRVESALFTPVAFGSTETHLNESFVPPAWVRGSESSDRTPIEVRPGEPAVGSAGRHLLGTDALGRDVLARLLHGGRLSLAVALLAALLVSVIGVVLGTLAGMFGGLVDLVFLRTVEIVQSFPAFLLILAGVAFLPVDRVHPTLMIALVIGLVGWTEIARLVRAELLRLRELELTTAAEALGIPPLRIAFRHLLPLALPPVLVAAAFATSGAVLTESAISFLGFGIGPPTPSWGGLIAVERDASIWWLQLFPGAMVFLTVLAFNLLGDGLRRTLPSSAGGDLRTSAARGGRA